MAFVSLIADLFFSCQHGPPVGNVQLEPRCFHPKLQIAESAPYFHCCPSVRSHSPPECLTENPSHQHPRPTSFPLRQHLATTHLLNFGLCCNIKAVIYTLGFWAPGCFKGIDHPGVLIHDSGLLLQLLCQLLIPMTLFINYERFIPHLLLHKRIHAFILQHDLLTCHHALHGKLNFWRLEKLRKFHRFN